MMLEFADHLFEQIIDFVKSAGDSAFEQWRSFDVVEIKDIGGDLATNLDREIERAFHGLCREVFPGCGFRGEELPDLRTESSNGYTWNIDPIDGTKNFANEVPIWSVTVSLEKNGTPIFGVIYNPVSRQLYTAMAGRGAYLNGRRLSFNAPADPARMQLAIDFFMRQEDPAKKARQDDLLAELFHSFYRVRSIGSGSLSLGWLAQGHFGGYLSWGLTENKFIDIAAGLVIAQEAGATVRIESLDGSSSVLVVGSEPTCDMLLALANGPGAL
ncbi:MULTISPECIES: inositol monophosphatase family protein [unclassified Streptomyces]|uniref:inositol monophosphatase family protein n=1 Tax=unclassified Streptomyces TaxID=2593676 RepID=UPI002E111A7B|nr:inositol monophosphatase family protein [Streptomyces sp. NBC_01207]WTA22686.1 inositol monophosphatase family protein [Streptomyces sp. NBC_00853]